jgi:GntR family transcriptional regulator / MocR family aminotransferase
LRIALNRSETGSPERVGLPDHLDEAGVVEAAARRGVAVHGLAPYRIAGEGRPGLIFGYATLDERMLAEGIELVAAATADARSGFRQAAPA